MPKQFSLPVIRSMLCRQEGTFRIPSWYQSGGKRIAKGKAPATRLKRRKAIWGVVGDGMNNEKTMPTKNSGNGCAIAQVLEERGACWFRIISMWFCGRMEPLRSPL